MEQHLININIYYFNEMIWPDRITCILARPYRITYVDVALDGHKKGLLT